MASRFRVRGMKRLRKKLKQLPDKLARKVIRKAVTAAGTPVVKQARQLMKNLPHSTGLTPTGATRKRLHRTLTKKTRTYKRSQTIVGIIGPRAKEAPHASLVESGTRPHEIMAKGRVLAGNGRFFGRRVRHPGSRGGHHLQRALLMKRSTALSKFTQKVRSELRKLK